MPVLPSSPALHSRSVAAWPWAAAVALLAIHASLAIDTLRRESVTVDEVGHLPAGISYWQQVTFELYHHNPPLVKLLAALPALASGPKVDYTQSWLSNRQRGLPLNQWAFGWEFMVDNAPRYQDIFVRARLPVVGLSVLAGWIVFLWAKELFGPLAGLVGLGLWTFCPNAIAHAGLVTTDMGATSLGFVATYLFWCYLRRPTWSRATVAGVVLGLAQLTKFSLLLYYGIWPAIWIVWQLRGRKAAGVPRKADSNRTPGSEKPRISVVADASPELRLRRSLGHIVAMLVASVFVINLGYLFEGSGTRLVKFNFLSRSLTRPRLPNSPVWFVPAEHPWREVMLQRQNRFVGTWLAQLPVPLPRHYVEGFDEQKLESEGINGQGYPVYLLGELRRTGWWWYYFCALAIKVPLGTWMLSLAAVIAAILRPSARAGINDEIVLLAPVIVVLFVMSFLTDINLGLRYVLPIFPFWFLLLSRVARLFDYHRIGVTAVVLLPLAWNVAACARIHPDHLAYFNELVGGPEQGYRYLIDSNLDWGQDLLKLETWLREYRPGQRVGLAYFGNVDPSILAASGRPIHFDLAPPGRFGDLNLAATKPGNPLFENRMRWIKGHVNELEVWLKGELARGRMAAANDHPAIRSLAFEQIGLREGPQPGLFAVSANLVAGLPFRLRDQMGNMWSAEQDAYHYFSRLNPIARAGYSIFIYEITLDEANRVRKELGLDLIDER